MSKVKSNWRKLMALGAVLTLTLIQSVSMSRATTSPTPQRTPSSEVKLDAEVRALDGFLDDWSKIDQQHRVLSRKTSVTSGEFNAFKSSSEGLKNRCSDFQQAIRDVIKKLKDADRWNGLDEEVLARTDDQKLKSDWRDAGGLKHLLEDASSQFCSQAAAEITSPIESLRPKLGAQTQDSFFDQKADYGLRMVRASYDPAPPVFTKGVRCFGATIRVSVHLIFTGTSGSAGQQGGNRECFCFDRCGSGSATS